MNKHTLMSPPPGHYSPAISSLGDRNNLFRSSGRTVIGRGNIDILDKVYKIREKKYIPGPGAYKKFSEFGETIN